MNIFKRSILLKFCQEEKKHEKLTSSFRIAASAFAFCKFSHALILASSLLALDMLQNDGISDTM